MSKGKGLGFLTMAALGAITGFATYLVSKDEFSDETKDKYDKVVSKIKNVGTDIKRTYTSIGDKEEFKNNTRNLGISAKNLAEKTGNLVASSSRDMYRYAKSKVVKAIENSMDDDNTNYDDLDESYVKAKKSPKKTKAKKVSKTTKTKKTSKKK